MTTEKKNYKETLNLPKTSFPMKANLSQNEPQTIKRWTKENLYKKLQEKTKEGSSFRFHDGPPYANGNIHVGHLLNKCLKDMVVRSQFMMGNNCPYTPGWDCHGLPIEHRVMSELSEEKLQKLAGLDEDIRRMAIRNDCAKYAEKFIKIQKEEMKRLLTLADYDNPYLTMNPKYESKVLSVFADLMAEGVVYRQLKPVHWSIANQTALADAELEYEDKIDLSIYVGFNATDLSKINTIFNTSLPEVPSFMIWTTTPWTLPANLAIAIHENYDYVLAEFDNDKTYIVAKERLETICESKECSTPKILGEVKGKELIGTSYQHPFCDRTGNVYHADYVTLEDGSGLVHTAPGHGEEDYQTGLREKLDIYCPVMADGTYDNSVPDWLKGKLIWDANKDIVTHLEKSGHLFLCKEFNHSYPHDWRSKTPVIFRSTEQWFISVDKTLKSSQKSIRNMAIDASKTDINFIPDWGEKRLHGMLESRPDWCISRQRSWGLPIPAFELPSGDVFMTEASIRAISSYIEKEGSDAWFKKSPEELLSHYNLKDDTEAPQNLDISKLKKTHDIFDVWFESGSSWNAVFDLKESKEKIDLYLEGSDQHRGWFQLSLLLSLGSYQKPAFKQILTHGFIVDKDGKKMSKSSGNALDVATLLKDYGAEVCRWWVSSLSFENDIKVDTSYFKIAGDTYRKMRNTLRFLLSNLSDYTPTEITETEINTFTKELSQHSLEAYILDELSAVEKTCIDAYASFRFREAHHTLYTFCNTQLSSFYCMAVKDRLYCDPKNSTRRKNSQKTMQIILEIVCRLLAPILPHTAEEAYASLHNKADISIHLQSPLSVSYTRSQDWEILLSLRPNIQKALENAKENGIENTLDCGLTLSDPDNTLSNFKNDLADMFGVSEVTLVTEKDILEVEDRREKPRCERSWKRDNSVKEREDGTLLSDRDYEAISSAKGV
ncbi:isoleucine--tRNA ligase [Candidatus Marinamargulisbacteria bacterium SCGC AG-439-L15]|nr:isoleucine--tRNA ligase [Candidatus Marinamargulisbacteria bacterium SCGC AG-439-L15]